MTEVKIWTSNLFQITIFTWFFAGVVVFVGLVFAPEFTVQLFYHLLLVWRVAGLVTIVIIATTFIVHAEGNTQSVLVGIGLLLIKALAIHFFQ